MSSPDAVPLENQIAFAFMSESDVREPRAALATDDAFGTGLTETGLLPILAGAAAAGAVVLALVAANAVAPLLLAVMGILAMLGGFLIFGLAAGHIRIGERVREEDLVKSLADGLDEAILVTTPDGTPVYANSIMRRLAKSRDGRSIAGLDTLFGSDPKAEAAYFRLMRAANRGEPWREEIEVRRPGDTVAQRWRVAERACSVKGHERDFGPLRVWTITDVTAERTAQANEVSSLAIQLERLDSAPAGLMEVDARGYVRRLNSTFLRWLGIEASRLASNGGLKLADLISAPDLEMLLSASLQVHANNTGLDVSMRADQGPLVAVKLFARRDAQGSLLVAAYPRDSVDTAEGVAGAADLRFARFFQSAPFGIATLDASGRLVNSNVAFGRLIPDGAAAHGLAITTLLARTADAETQRAIEAAVAAVLTGTATPSPIEISFGQHKDTSRRLFLAPLSEKSSNREVATLYVIDATEQEGA